ncbi:tRNA uridine-5-carboxymethylaminomethyl(34) synthesis GTPase MnmE [Sphingomonas sp. MMS24-J13]|uniref:tRNA uridine-5-carboxymethylaminomethyl(34) synthesis GTPase MnmE n=1 Tax=Sphingomonas sp. MMS24-J13 TaxID=3238686 RepID=UPI0038510035
MARDTIFALSSGALPAAIAVIRLSGPATAGAVQALAGVLPKPRRAVVRTLVDAEGAALDRVLLLWLPGPGTATGEDMAELHLHGGRAVAAAVQGALGGLPGLRPAEPGEFTRRAFANGRIDLAEAEGLADLIAAESEGQRRQAIRLAEGGLGRLIDGWRDRLLGLAAHVEAAIEFGEEEGDVPALGTASHDALDRLALDMRTALDQPPAERLRDGLRVVLAGPVNAGKSSLINALAGRDVAIATPIEGTTRDIIEAPVMIDGLPLILVDSAGLRESVDPVEQAGIARARDAIETADIILWLGPAAEAPSEAIIVHPRADLPDRAAMPAGSMIAVSTVTGQGLAGLRAMMIDRARTLLAPTDRVALNERHRGIIAEAMAELTAAGRNADAVIVAEHLRIARTALDRIAGRAGVEDMLNSLFGRFCIGK